jgi:hypothetical protein
MRWSQIKYRRDLLQLFNIPGRFPVPASGGSLRFVIPLSCGRVDLVRIPRDAFSICNAALACDARLLLWLSAGAGVLFFFRLRVDGRWSFSSHKASFGFLLLVPDLVLILAMIEWFLVWHWNQVWHKSSLGSKPNIQNLSFSCIGKKTGANTWMAGCKRIDAANSDPSSTNARCARSKTPIQTHPSHTK